MADLEWDYAYIDLASSEKESHEWNEGQKHDARIILMGCRRENSVNMNLEVEDPLYAKVQRRGSSVSRQQQGSLTYDVRIGCVGSLKVEMVQGVSSGYRPGLVLLDLGSAYCQTGGETSQI